jgi:hypothetical protein
MKQPLSKLAEMVRAGTRDSRIVRQRALMGQPLVQSLSV